MTKPTKITAFDEKFVYILGTFNRFLISKNQLPLMNKTCNAGARDVKTRICTVIPSFQSFITYFSQNQVSLLKI